MFLAGKADRQPPANAGKPERWAECLNTDNTPKWESIAVMGGSEGAGQAAYVGYRRKVDRVMQFSGIDDAVNYNLAAGNCELAPCHVPLHLRSLLYPPSLSTPVPYRRDTHTYY